MEKVSDTYKKLGIDFSFPIVIRDSNGDRTYYENIYGDCCKWEYDSNGNVTYYENSKDYWHKSEYDANGNRTYYENSDGYKGGTPHGQSCAGKVIEVDGKKYKLMEL